MGANDEEKRDRPHQERDDAPVSLANAGVLALREQPGITARDVSLRQNAPDEERKEAAHQDERESDGEDVFSEKTATELDKDLERGIESHDHADTESEASTEGSPSHSPTTARPPQGELRQTLSRTTSTFSRTAAIVPRSERRGLLGRVALIPELERPYDYKNKTKWIITAIVGFAAIAAPLGSAILYPALDQISADLGSTPTVTNLSIAFYMLSMSIFPLWWSSFSETLGRRTVYVVSFSMFVIFSVLSAVSTSIGMFIAMRILGGGASASVQAVGAGTLADIWEPRERGRAMGFFYLGPLIGPLTAPVFGGLLAQRWGWRSTMWFLVIVGGVILPMIIVLLPETLARQKPLLTTTAPSIRPIDTLSRKSTRQSVQEHTKRAGMLTKRLFVDPLQALLYLRFPPVAITVYLAAITFGSLFVMNISIQASFSSPPYQFSELIVGLLYIAPSLGYFVASVLGGRWIDRIMAREAEKAGRYDENGKLIYLPEDRLRENAWLAATVYPAALIWYGWTVDKGVYWLCPEVATFFFGCSSMLVFGASATMLTEFMPKGQSSQGVAVNNFVRNIFSCVGAIVSQPLINAMGNGWLFTMISLVACTTGCACIWSLRHWGPKWRVTMDRKLG